MSSPYRVRPKSSSLDRIVAELCVAFAAQARRDLLVKGLVIDGFEATGDRKDRVRRMDVYRHVAGRLNVHLNNDRCNEIRTVALSLPGVYPVVGGRVHWFRGLRKRP